MNAHNRHTYLKSYDDLYLEYSKIDSTQSMSAEKKAFWIEGKPEVRKALFLAHGYMGTPGEMLYLAEPFLQQGWSVIGFLIPGHGSTAKVANAYLHERWREEMIHKLNLVTTSFDEVHAIGFSTGGLLLHDHLLRHPTPETLKSLHLISPYFLPRIKTFFDGLLEKILNARSVDLVYFFTRFPDLKVMMIDRQYYNQTLPIKTAREIKRLGKMVYELVPNRKISFPVQLFLTAGDWTVKVSATKKILERDAVNLTLNWYPENSPHHLMVPSVSKRAKDVQDKIAQLLHE
jgi:esterase/lipase